MLSNTQAGWGLISITLHWLSGAAVVGLFILGWWMTGLGYYDSWYHAAPWWHRSAGMLLLFATLIRLCWRVAQPTPASHGHGVERLAASLGHAMLYVLLLGVLVSGYLISTAQGDPISVFDWFRVPASLAGLPDQATLAGRVHWYVAIALLVMSAGHALAAMKHHWIDGNDTLLRMLDPRRAKGRFQDSSQLGSQRNR